MTLYKKNGTENPNIIIESELSIKKITSELTAISNNNSKFDITSNEFNINNNNARFFRITELSKQEQFLLRQDLENVIACMVDDNYAWCYFLSGTDSGIEIYIGIVLQKIGEVYDESKLLESQLLGNITGISLESLNDNDLQNKILSPLKASEHVGLLTGIPSLTIDSQAQNKGQNITQGIDRLARSLIGEDWQMLIIAQPVELKEINEKIDDLLHLSTMFSSYKTSIQEGVNTSHSSSETQNKSQSYAIAKQSGTSYSKAIQSGTNKSITKQDSKSATKIESKSSTSAQSSDSNSETKTEGSSDNHSKTDSSNEGKTISDSNSEGSSTSKTQTETKNRLSTSEIIDRKVEHIDKYLSEKQLPRFEQGRSKGLFNTAIYLSAKYPAMYKQLILAVKAIFQGNQSSLTPLKVSKINISGDINKLFTIHWQERLHAKETLLINSTPMNNGQYALATYLNANELSLLAGLPSREVCGIRLRKNVDFAVNPLVSNDVTQQVKLGAIIQNGRELKNSHVFLSKQLLNQHIFICGVTGAGKTTTCLQILLNAELPFLVIEPAKTEYRALYQHDKEVQYYTLNNELVSPFRFNPFELLPGEQLGSHIDILKATFAAVFPMEASMPYLIEEAIIRSYESKGWDIHTSSNFIYPKPFEDKHAVFPIMSEMLEQLKLVIKSKNFGQDLQEKYEGSLISRLDNLTVGSKGKMLNTRVSIDIDALLTQKVVIELDELKDEQDKALIMGLLIGRISEAVKQRHMKDANFRHLTLIEEAHRLLEKTQGYEDGAKKLGVNLFANLLAEVRKYGEGLIIADQIPNKLASEVIKNTNTKIIHRLFAADDRQTMGETIGLTEEQIDFLPMLKAGEAIIYSAGWHEAARVQIQRAVDTNAKPIDVTLIAEHSQQRIYKQREHFYPNISKNWNNCSATDFNDFIQQGSIVLNLWLKWYHLDKSVNQENNQNDCHYYHIIYERLITEMQGFEERWNNQTDIFDALAALFIDIVPVAYLDLDSEVSECLKTLFKLYKKKGFHSKQDFYNLFDFELEHERDLQSSLNKILTNIKSI